MVTAFCGIKYLESVNEMKSQVAYKVYRTKYKHDGHSFTMFAYNCGGQNKKYSIIKMYASRIIKLNLKEINLF